MRTGNQRRDRARGQTDHGSLSSGGGCPGLMQERMDGKEGVEVSYSFMFRQ